MARINPRLWCSSLFVLQLTASPVSAAPGLLPGLPAVDEVTWNTTAVRKVLAVFAYGGQPADDQIQRWADATPALAIAQMLTFAEHNLLLSPPSSLDRDGLKDRRNSLTALSKFWSSENPANQIPGDRRQGFARSEWSGAFETWTMAARTRGGNPFRHKIGFWETNYHLAVNHQRGVSNFQLTRMYDDMLGLLGTGAAYETVIAKGSLSAAIARQYGHEYNVFYGDTCYCNEDFAREFHQLGFGVLGKGEKTYHETVTIKNTAKILTAMSVVQGDAPTEWEGDTLTFGTDGHVTGPVQVLHQQIAGSTMGKQLPVLAALEIRHPESLANLPVMIIQGLASDNPSKAEIAGLRQAWASMARKDLLIFLRAYAISTYFHSPTRIKQWTSIERFMLVANNFAHSNLEQYYDVPEEGRLFWDEEFVPFEPWHDVFGHQNSNEAAGSAELFRKHLGAATDGAYRFTDVNHDFGGRNYKKDWRRNLAPTPGTLQYRVDTTAEWLWNRFIADGLKNFGPLERAQVYSLLAYGTDAAEHFRPSNENVALTLTDLQGNAAIAADLARVGNKLLPLAHTNVDIRDATNRRIGAAISFIIATPFMFAQEGR